VSRSRKQFGAPSRPVLDLGRRRGKGCAGTRATFRARGIRRYPGERGRRIFGGRRGFALLLVLFLSILLTVGLLGFVSETNTAARLARSRADSWRLLFAARSALEESKARLWRQLRSSEETKALLSAPPPEERSIDGVSLRLYYEDEAGKLPVNGFAGRRPGAGGPARGGAGGSARLGGKELVLALARLFDRLDLDDSTRLASTTRDFIDPDSEGLRESGARDAPIYHLSQLFSAEGFSRQKLYAPQREGLPAAADCLSAWNDGAVNINTAPWVVLESLSPGLTDEQLEAIIEARSESPFRSGSDFRDRAGVSGEAAEALLGAGRFECGVFTIFVEARIEAMIRRLKAVVSVEQVGAKTLYVEESWQF